MIYSSVTSSLDLKIYPQVIREAVDFIKNTNFDEIDAGEYEVSGRDIYYQVMDITTQPVSRVKPEVHRKYIDLQFLFRGKESIGVVDDTGNNEIDTDLLVERDLLFYKNVEDVTFITMKEGDYCVFFPSDVHMPGCERDGQSTIRKIVYKIKVDLLY